MSNAFTDAVDARLAEADAAIRERDAERARTGRADKPQRPSLADAVALACKAQSDLMGRALTDEEHGCIRAGFHGGLSYRLESDADSLLRALVGDVAPVPGVYTPEQGHGNAPPNPRAAPEQRRG